MRKYRQALFGVLLSTTAWFGSAACLAADDFPGKPIRVIVPYLAGGADTYVRPLQPALEKNHGITLVIESVVGAGGTVGANRVKRSAPDGYTLLFSGSGALTIAPKLNGDSLSFADFSPVLNLVTIPYILAVRKDSPIRTGREFIDYVKQNPGKLNYGSAGIGSAPHLAFEAMAINLGIKATHVPFPGIVASVQSLLGGHIDAVIGAPGNVMAQVRAGQLVALAVSSKERFALTPQLPTLSELGAPVDVATHFGFHAPQGTPAAVIAKLANAIREAARDPAFVTTMETMQTQVDLLAPDAFLKVLSAESAYFDPVIARLPKQ